MEPSSLILVAIIGVWVAYLVPNWLRRRDDLMQARAHDRFSSRLRVLNRRRRTAKSQHRSGDAVLASPRVIVDAEGELLFIAGDREKAAELRAAEEAAAAIGSGVVVTAVESVTKTVREVVEELAETPARKIAVAAARVERVARVHVSARVSSEPRAVDGVAAGEWKVEKAVEKDIEARKAAVEVEKGIVEGVGREVGRTASRVATPGGPGKASVNARAALVTSGEPPAKAPAGFKVAASARAAAGTVLPSGKRPPAPSKEVAAFRRDLEAATATGRTAATRRARIMIGLIVACVSAWGVASVESLWIGLPATLLLVLHAVASRAAALRSREHLAVLSAQLQAAEAASSPTQRKAAPSRRPATPPASVRPAPSVTRKAVGSETWQPVPVPPPTYTLKPAVQRPEPVPLDLPAAPKPAAAHKPAANASAVSRGALPRTAADIERILALDSDQDGYEHRTA